jgi:hypothetical protein
VAGHIHVHIVRDDLPTRELDVASARRRVARSYENRDGTSLYGDPKDIPARSERGAKFHRNAAAGLQRSDLLRTTGNISKDDRGMTRMDHVRAAGHFESALRAHKEGRAEEAKSHFERGMSAGRHFGRSKSVLDAALAPRDAIQQFLATRGTNQPSAVEQLRAKKKREAAVLQSDGVSTAGVDKKSAHEFAAKRAWSLSQSADHAGAAHSARQVYGKHMAAARAHAGGNMAAAAKATERANIAVQEHNNAWPRNRILHGQVHDIRARDLREESSSGRWAVVNNQKNGKSVIVKNHRGEEHFDRAGAEAHHASIKKMNPRMDLDIVPHSGSVAREPASAATRSRMNALRGQRLRR